MKPHIWKIGAYWWACATTDSMAIGFVALGATPMDAYRNLEVALSFG